MDNEKKQQYVYNYMKWQAPNHFYIGKINFEDLKLSTTKIKKQIKERQYTGWEDPRLPFLRALKKRGYRSSTFLKFAEQIGLTENDKKVSIKEFFKNVNALNKELIDPKANRYFFIANPVKKKIKNAPKLKAEHPIHPNFPRRGKRTFQGKDEFYLAKDDVSKFRNNQLIRLMGLLNFKVKQGQLHFDSKEYEKAKAKKAKLIHWLPVSKSLVKTTVIMPDNSKVKGWAEPGIKKLKEDDVIQFERMGFCRLDNKKNMTFYYAHN
jgi:glutamyl-tRNA synthetase